MKKNIISLFTGAGGLDWGFHKIDDFEVIASNEILKPHLKTYTNHYDLPLLDLEEYSNEKEVGICGDIHNLTIPFESNILLGGPPCQDFSLLRGSEKREGIKVQRGKLYQQYLRIIKSSNPDIFVFENVHGMISANKGLAYKAIQHDFIKEGYDLIFNQIIDFSNVGVPQSRKRLLIIGLKKELNKNPEEIQKIIDKYLKNKLLSKYPITPLEVFEGKTLDKLQEEYEKIIKEFKGCTIGLNNTVSLKWIEEYDNLSFNIIQDYLNYNNIQNFDETELNLAMKEHEKILKIMGFYNKNIENEVFKDKTNKLPRKNKNIIERMHHIPPFYNFKVVENTPWKVKGLMSNIYRRLHPLIPSTTIIAYGGGGTGGYHYKYNRQGLTNRERARLQTFPDNYLFNGKSSEIRAQIGEAVPPLASYWIAKVVEEILEINI